MYKCVHGFPPKLLFDMIMLTSEVNETNTRIQIQLMFIYLNLMFNVIEKSFKYVGGKVWDGA